ncbi:MAG: histidine phosphatase family protein [Ignavibacterium sp.]|jgi:serine/threonine-protein phosphatase PGAM5|nr:histidine phosphatase family protein [Ignavibacterium sp.]
MKFNIKKINLKSLLIIFLFTISLVENIYSQTSDSEKKGTRTIYLIRHGHYDEADERDEYTGKELTPLGITQARLVAARLKAMPVNFTSLISSTMTRARQTAMIINQEFPELELKQNALISECTPPTWREDVMAKTDSAEVYECVENIEKAFQEYFIPSPDEKDRNDIIVCHGNVIRYFVTKVLKVDSLSWLQMSITNCSLTIIRITPNGSMKLDAFSDYGHIPENLRTFTGRKNEEKELVVPVKQ